MSGRAGREPEGRSAKSAILPRSVAAATIVAAVVALVQLWDTSPVRSLRGAPDTAATTIATAAPVTTAAPAETSPRTSARTGRVPEFGGLDNSRP